MRHTAVVGAESGGTGSTFRLWEFWLDRICLVRKSKSDVTQDDDDDEAYLIAV